MNNPRNLIHKSFINFRIVFIPDIIQYRIFSLFFFPTTCGKWNKCSHIIIYFRIFSSSLIATNGHQFYDFIVSFLTHFHYRNLLCGFSSFSVLFYFYQHAPHLRQFILRVRKSKCDFHLSKILCGMRWKLTADCLQRKLRINQWKLLGITAGLLRFESFQLETMSFEKLSAGTLIEARHYSLSVSFPTSN